MSRVHRFKNKFYYFTGLKQHDDSFSKSKSGLALAAICSQLVPSAQLIKGYASSTNLIFQNCLLVWLDMTMDDMNKNDYNSTIAALRRIINAVCSFSTASSCTEFIRNIEQETVFLLISGVIDEPTLSYIHHLPQINSIYIYNENRLAYEDWIHRWPKLQKIFQEMSLLYETLKDAAQECDRNSIVINFLEVSDENFNAYHHSFMFTQVLKEVILTKKFTEKDIQEFAMYYREKLTDNFAQLKNMNQFEKEYRDFPPIWWYTYRFFLGSMLNRALRTMDVATLIKMSFFIFDLEQYISKVHSEEKSTLQHSKSFNVYRGQIISENVLDQLKKSENQLISFNNFLCASTCRSTALTFARQTVSNVGLMGILLCITVDPLIDSIAYANIRQGICYPAEEDFIFSLNPVFRVNQLKPIGKGNTRLWQVDLTLISNEDPQLQILKEHILESISPCSKQWYRLSEFLINERQIDQALIIFEILKSQKSDENDGYLNYQLGLMNFIKEEYIEANKFYNSALQVFRKIRSPDHIDLAACYDKIGLVYETKGDFSPAISFFEKAIDIYEKNPLNTDTTLISLYQNIGRIYFQTENHSKSLLYYKKIIEIDKNTHVLSPSTAVACYSSMAVVYEKLGDYSKAIESLEQTLPILENHLSNPIDTASCYNYIGSLDVKLKQYSTALSHYNKALQLNVENLPPDHPNIALCNRNIGKVYFERNDYSEALSHYEKAHQIYQKHFSACQFDLAASYIDHGSVYEQMGNFTKALLYYNKAWDTYQNVGPFNHHYLVMSLHKIGLIYYNICEYSVALSCQQRAIKICQKNLSEHDPDLVLSYMYMGDIYDRMGDRLNALSFYKSAHEIVQASLLENDVMIEPWKNMVELLKQRLNMDVA